MTRYLFVLFCLSLCLACDRPEDLACDAFVCVRSQGVEPDDIIAYRWGAGEEYTDTLHPGECAVRVVENFSMTYDFFGNLQEDEVKLNFISSGGNIPIEVDACVIEVPAPDRYLEVIDFCSNGVFDWDQGEQDTDCGGDCDPCPQPFTNCSPAPYHISWQEDRPSHPRTADSAHISLSPNDSIVCLAFFGANERLEVRFLLQDMPLESRRFDVGYFCSIQYKAFFNKIWTAKEDQPIYLEVDEAGNYTLNFCDLKFITDDGSHLDERTMANASIKLTRTF